MSAWFVLSALGLYQMCPGNPIYTIGSPLFGRAALHADGRPSAVIESPDNSEARVYVDHGRSALDGASLRRSWVAYDELTSAAGCRLHLAMVDAPDIEGGAALEHWRAASGDESM